MTPKFGDTSNRIGRGAMYAGRSHIERGGGLHTRENAGISSASGARNSAIESQRFPGEGSSTQGKSGAKLRPKGVDDAQSVDIPIPPKVYTKQGHRRIAKPR